MPKFREKKIEGNICDLEREKFFPGRILIKNGKIFKVEKVSKKFKNYILPGFIDSHCHIESSFLSPPLFGALAISQGTVSVVADCHEIANVLGEKGILWMIKGAKLIPFKFFWALPSCVPATKFETTPNKIGKKEVKKFLKRKEFVALGEVMDFPAVIKRDKEILEKIKIAKKLKKPIDGHCPKLSGKDLKKYIETGISTDHECTSLKEAKEKQKLGMLIQIREGSAAKNLRDLIGLNYQKCCLVTDDLEVKDLIKGHLNEVLRKAIKLGVPLFKAIKMVTKIPAEHYRLNFGEIKVGKEVNLVEFENLKDFKPKRVWIEGKLGFEKGKILFPIKTLNLETAIKVKPKSEKDFAIKVDKKRVKVRLIEVIPNQILTKERIFEMRTSDLKLKPDLKRDILKIAVINRYELQSAHHLPKNWAPKNIGLGFVKGFGLKEGALASSISHDSHNLICIGTNNKDMAKAVNILRKSGGFVFISKNKKVKVKLPLAGLMTNENPQKLVKNIKILESELKKAGCKLKNPLSQISFLALLVIPELRISDKGLFNVKNFQFKRLII
ncbi:MAG: adenine deaminase [Patescibacteria group bacterium]|nr:adenine deaminase [Patescibacteria group bacterium]